jgi:hypothetical protein
MKTIVFVFVPVYRDQQGTEAAFQADMRAAVRKMRLTFFRQHQSPRQPEPPFWTWFIDNPRPSSTHPS